MTFSEVAIIIPVYNEAQVIGDVIKNVRKHFQNIICIDDGSIDTSADIIEKAGGILIKHPLNLGQGAAIQTGIEYALLNEGTKYFVTYDADGQHKLEDVLSMLDTIDKKNIDIVLGSRFLGTAENITWLKGLILRTAVVFSNRTSGIKLTDAHNGLRVFNRKVATLLEISMSDYSHASEIIDRIATYKFSYAEVPVTIMYTDYSRKKGQSILNAVNIGFDMILNRVTRR